MIHLDLKRGEISFSINGTDQGIAFSNIKQEDNISYRLYIASYWKDSTTEIIDFCRK